MLKQTQATLDDNVLEDGSWGNVDGLTLCRHNDDGTLEDDTATKVDRTGDGEVVKLNDLGDAGDALLEVGHLLEVTTELDQRSITEAGCAHLELAVLDGVEIRLDKHQIRASLDGQEAATGNVDTVGVLEVLDGSTNSGLQLENANVRLALLITGDGLAVGDDLHLELVILDDALDGLDVHPDVVGVEVLELLDGLELVDMLLGDLGDFEKADAALVVNDGTTLDIGLGLVGQLHDVLGFALNHVLENAEINNGAEVVSVGKEDDLDATVDELVKNTRVVEGLENVTVSGRIPVMESRVKGLGDWEEGVLEDSGVPRLVKGKNVDVMTLILLDNRRGIIVGVERVHEENGDVGAVAAVEVLDLADGHVKERHAITDLDDRLGTNATHGGTKTTVELENSKLVEEANRLGVGQVLVIDDLASSGRSNAVPRAIISCQPHDLRSANSEEHIHLVALSLVIEIAAEQGEEVVHLGLEQLLLLGVLHGLGEVGESIAHLGSSNVGRGVLESLVENCGLA